MTVPAAAQDENPFRMIALGRYAPTSEAARTVTEFLSDSDVPSDLRADGYLHEENYWFWDPVVWAAGTDLVFRRLRDLESESLRRILSLNDALDLGFDPSFLTLDDDDLAYRVGLAWVSYDKDRVLAVGECGPPESWARFGEGTEHCIESDDNVTFIVKMKVGHPGFPLFELAVNGEAFDLLSPEDQQEQMNRTEQLASTSLAERLSDSWLLTAVDIGRTVSFWLYRPGDNEPYRKAEGEEARPGPMITMEETGKETRNTCGGSTSACPIFYVPEDTNDWRQLDDDTAKLPRDWLR